MIEVIVTLGVASTLGGLWYKSFRNFSDFNTTVCKMNAELDQYIKLNAIEYVDYDIRDKDDPDTTVLKKNFSKDIVHNVAKEIEKGYDLYHFTINNKFDSLEHKHNFSDEFFYVLKGEISLTTNKFKDKIIKSGEYIFIKQKTHHKLTGDPGTELIIVAKPSLIKRK